MSAFQLMNDFKNFLIAYFSTAPSLFAAIETRTLITVISAIVLPILFFTVGKTIDVILQIYLEKRKRKSYAFTRERSSRLKP